MKRDIYLLQSARMIGEGELEALGRSRSCAPRRCRACRCRACSFSLRSLMTFALTFQAHPELQLQLDVVARRLDRGVLEAALLDDPVHTLWMAALCVALCVA